VVWREQFVSDRTSYIILRSRWCDILVLNVRAATDDKCDDTKGSFYEELERVFDQFPKCHMRVLLADFKAKVRREATFKPIIGNESLHETRNDRHNGVTSLNLVS
jgi:hypothetical protein